MTNRAFQKRIKDAITDPNLQTALDRATSTYWLNREEVFAGLDFECLRTELRSCKDSALDHIPELFDRFKSEAEGIGAKVYQASGGEEVSRIVLDIARAHNVKNIVKSKSMVTEEIELNKHLIAEGLHVTETDLGEWILQLNDERPSHVTMPAMHKTREQVAEIFSRTHDGEDVPTDIPALVEFARKHIRQAFLDADMGISGANIAIADTGTLVIVSNEGNARLVTSLPEVHVAILTYEKLMPSLDDATAVLKLLSKSGTGQKMTSYVSFISGPSRTSDIEKTLTIGVHGPKEVHIIFVDNGRMALLNDPEFREALCCIKCGACMTVCPVYRSVGGHVFGNKYFGGIGAVLESFIGGLDSAEDIADICTTCGRCTTYCPSKIDIPRMVLALRHKISGTKAQPLVQRAILQGLLGRPDIFDTAMNLARKTQAVWQPLKRLPIPWMSGLKHAPDLADKPFHERVRKINRPLDVRRGTVAFYPGCVIEHVYPEIGESVVHTLTTLGWEVRLPEGQGCCGFPALIKGDEDTACKLAHHNVCIADFGDVDYIITACPTCQTALKDEFVRLLGSDSPDARAAEEMSKKVHLYSDFMTNLLGVDLSEFVSKERRGMVTYHDPCHARHGQGITEGPRALLQIAGCEVVEMAQPDTCCGFAGSYSLSHPDISGEIAGRKIANILATGAPIVATDCPGCLIQLRARLSEAGSDVKAMHTAEIIWQGISETSTSH